MHYFDQFLLPGMSSSSALCWLQAECLVGSRQCVVSMPTRHCPVGRVLLKSGRPQTATGSDHGHQGRTLAGERGRIIRGEIQAHTPDIMDADCWAQSGHSRRLPVRVHCGAAADTWSPTPASCQGRTRFTLLHIPWGLLPSHHLPNCPHISQNTCQHKDLAGHFMQ